MIYEFRGNHYYLSNFYKCKIVYKDIEYSSVESAFQAQKVIDESVRKEFAHLSPSEAKRKGRSVILRDDWDDVKDKLMYDIVLQKFLQNTYLKSKLLSTGKELLVEGNTWNDTYWGVCRGKGLNKLGRILMEIRSILN